MKRSHYEEAISTLGQELETKTYNSSFGELQNKFQVSAIDPSASFTYLLDYNNLILILILIMISYPSLFLFIYIPLYFISPQNLDYELNRTKEGLSVVTRFVQWFTERGTHHEHNITIIDEHLKKLVHRNVSPLMQTTPESRPMKFYPLP